jgi:hypothetical protein
VQFTHTWQKVLSGEKTQTRQLVKAKPKGVTVGTYYDFEILTADPVWFEDGTVKEFDKRVITIYTRQTGWVHADYCIEPDEDVTRIKWQVGRTYAVQPSRTSKAVARIRITDIRREDVRTISAEDAHAEGFGTDPCYSAQFAFLETWIFMHDKELWRKLPRDAVMPGWRLAQIPDPVSRLQSRPAALYDAWVLDFEVVK